MNYFRRFRFSRRRSLKYPLKDVLIANTRSVYMSIDFSTSFECCSNLVQENPNRLATMTFVCQFEVLVIVSVDGFWYFLLVVLHFLFCCTFILSSVRQIRKERTNANHPTLDRLIWRECGNLVHINERQPQPKWWHGIDENRNTKKRTWKATQRNKERKGKTKERKENVENVTKTFNLSMH